MTVTEGRADDRNQQREQFVDVDARGSLPLPAHVLQALPPGTRLRVVRKPGGVELVVEPPNGDRSGPPR